MHEFLSFVFCSCKLVTKYSHHKIIHSNRIIYITKNLLVINNPKCVLLTPLKKESVKGNFKNFGKESN